MLQKLRVEIRGDVSYRGGGGGGGAYDDMCGMFGDHVEFKEVRWVG